MKLGKQVDLKDFSNFRIGGPARDFVRADSMEELVDSVKTARQIGLPVFVLGGGTNILWSDDGFEGLVLQPALDFAQVDGNYVTAGAGISMSKLVSVAISCGLAGLEWAGGLPGTLGGAVVVNAGCFGGEMKESIQEVISLNMDTLELVRRKADECGFDYRDSIFKIVDPPEIIVQATVKLSPGNKMFLNKSVEDKIRYREKKQPLEYPNIGSIFKNVRVDGLPSEVVDEHRNVVKDDPFPVIPAAHLISKAKLKGLTVGGAVVSPKHPNFIVNMRDAKSRDVKELIELIKERVNDRFGMVLEEEVVIMG